MKRFQIRSTDAPRELEVRAVHGLQQTHIHFGMVQCFHGPLLFNVWVILGCFRIKWHRHHFRYEKR